jgi:NADH-quinone oxidoreductase subunit L
VFAIALIAAFITAFYVARLWFRVFVGPEQTDELHEAHNTMLVPMVLLASITSVIGIGGYWFAEFLGHEGAWPAPVVYLPSLVAAGAGLALSWWAYGRLNIVLNTRPLKQRAGYIYGMLSRKLYFDLTYDTFIIRPFMRLALVFAVFDFKRIDGAVNGVARSWRDLSESGWTFDRRVIDGAVNASATGAKALGSRLRRIQGGRVQAYQRYVVGAVVLLMLWTVVKGA